MNASGDLLNLAVGSNRTQPEAASSPLAGFRHGGCILEQQLFPGQLQEFAVAEQSFFREQRSLQTVVPQRSAVAEQSFFREQRNLQTVFPQLSAVAEQSFFRKQRSLQTAVPEQLTVGKVKAA